MTALNECLVQHTLQCMEIWGGSHDAENAVSTPGLDLWIYSRPFERATAGGDVHYVSLCGGGIITRFILADVAGHGTDVADLARELRSLMRQNINRKSHSRLVKELNGQFAALGRAGRFATAIVATYLTSNRRLTICNAGHPPPLYFCAKAGEWSIASGADETASTGAANLPLGIDGEAGYDENEIPLERGDCLLFYTDGLVEAADRNGALLGETGLLEMVRRLKQPAAEQIPRALIEALDRFRGGCDPEDDLTFLLLRHTAGPRRRMSLREKLNVYAKVFRLKRV
ncbi:MAG TPA: PP2C family protein-serine/threonine phosphatase [Planctomycetaceae bacterium]|nr:PP2C family protein-serine/threonine phosphatase [Planctomycetaceae bacterium]